LPFGDMLSTSVRDQAQLSQGQNSSIFPMKAQTFNYQGQVLPLYKVPTDSGVKDMALLKKGTKSSQFVDPANPGAEPFVYQGTYRTLEAVQTFSPTWENFPEAWNK